MQIRAARVNEHATLTALALSAKAHWGYAQSALARWHGDLTVAPASIATQPTFVAERDGAVAGFFQLSTTTTRAELEHLWVDPQRMRQGIGRALLQRALAEAHAAGHRALHVDADPHAEAFYLGCGGVRTGEVAAPIEGEPQRVRPQLRLSTLRHHVDTGASAR